jgi:hypothetical protein
MLIAVLNKSVTTAQYSSTHGTHGTTHNILLYIAAAQCSARLITLCLDRVLEWHALSSKSINSLAQGTSLCALLDAVEGKTAGLQYQQMVDKYAHPLDRDSIHLNTSKQ